MSLNISVEMIYHSLVWMHLSQKNFTHFDLQSRLSLKINAKLFKHSEDWRKFNNKLKIEASAFYFIDVHKKNRGHIDFYPNRGSEQPGICKPMFVYFFSSEYTNKIIEKVK